MRIGWVLWDSITPGRENASSRIRARWVQKYMPNSLISNDFDVLKKMDAVIFQKRFTPEDVDWARRLRKQRKIVIFDITDPEWHFNYKHYDANKQGNLKAIIDYSHVVTVPTEVLASSFKEYFPNTPIVVIPDRVDLELYPTYKTHTKKQGPYTIFWHGTHSNTDSIDLARDDLQLLGSEIPIKLVCCYGPTMDNRIKPIPGVPIEQIAWTEDKCTELLLQADVSINPRYSGIRSYKSDNKTIKAIACGVPCVERDYCHRIKQLLNNVNMRNQLGYTGRIMVENHYDAKKSVKDYMEIIDKQKNPPLKYINTRNGVAVVSCITASTDNLLEGQNTDGADFIMFTDNPELKSETWQIMALKPDLLVDPRRQSRMVKWLMHKYLYQYEYTLWLDGNMTLLTPVRTLIDMFLSNHDLATFNHKDRVCVYQEADDCIRNKLDDIQLIRSQMDRYRNLGYPVDNGLSELPAILRRHNEKIDGLGEAIWAEYSTQSRRDQLCFDFVVWNLGIKIARFPGRVSNSKDNTHFKKVQHTRENRRVL